MESEPRLDSSRASALGRVLLFWVGYAAIIFVAGFVTSKTISSEVLRLTTWGFVSTGGLIALSVFMARSNGQPPTPRRLALRAESLRRFAIGLLVGVVSYGVHIAVITVFAGPIHFDVVVPSVGALAALLYFARFVSTSCMEEVGSFQVACCGA